ncbi:amidohydrolase [Cohnella sp. 56]|uniref:amidohydrolase n=1 Tax=Cohnella sp. 56 TaxID=3113722 RepID=UPI0030E860AE
MTIDVRPLLDSVQDEVVAWRRYLHQHPELSFQEVKTAAYVYEALSSIEGLELSRPTRTSVMARLTGELPGVPKVLAVRADMDALPIQEQNEFEFVSRTDGVMHACGHDAHTAVLLGAVKVLAQLTAHFCGEIRFLFQHAEEVPPGGAREMIAAGVLDGVDWIIGAHLWSHLALGKMAFIEGPAMAATDSFRIVVKGKGGHAASPHRTIDSIAIAAQVITNLQHIVARNTSAFDQAVVSVTQINGGTANNVIPDAVELGGTIRTFVPDVREQIVRRMETVVGGITQAHEAEYELTVQPGYQAVMNDPALIRALRQIAIEAYGAGCIEPLNPSMGGEDFSAYQTVIPGAYFFVGAGNAEQGIVYPHHHPRFTIDEQAMATQTSMFVRAALTLLGSSHVNLSDTD